MSSNLLEALADLGVAASLDGDDLVLRSTTQGTLTPAFVAEWKPRKAAIVEALRERAANHDPSPDLHRPRPCSDCGRSTSDVSGMCFDCEVREMRFHRLGTLMPRGLR